MIIKNKGKRKNTKILLENITIYTNQHLEININRIVKLKYLIKMVRNSSIQSLLRLKAGKNLNFMEDILK